MGVAIEYRTTDLAAACNHLMDDTGFWMHCRNEALEYAREMDWSVIFSKALTESES
jgi:hypothetical protein